MKFSSTKWLFAVFSLLLISGCASLNSPTNKSGYSGKNTAQDPSIEMTPIQVKAESLKRQANLYQVQGKQKTSDIPKAVLTQFQTGLRMKAEGNISAATDIFSQLSKQYPSLSGLWLQLAMLSKSQPDQESVLRLQVTQQYLEQAVAANPLNYMAHNELAQVLRQQGQFDNALRHYQLALKSWPAFAEAYLNRGILYDLYLGQKELALGDYQIYQALTGNGSRQVKGWVIDLKRQLKANELAAQQGAMP